MSDNLSNKGDHMRHYGIVEFKDLLDGTPLTIDGLQVDTQVDVVVRRVTDRVFEIDSCSFGIKDVYVLPEESSYQVTVSPEENGVFMRKVEMAIEKLALKIARELPDAEWLSVDDAGI